MICPRLCWKCSLSRTAARRYHDQINQLKKQMIVDAVKQCKGNYTEAAKLLGVHPNYLHRLIRNLNIKGELKGE